MIDTLTKQPAVVTALVVVLVVVVLAMLSKWSDSNSVFSPRFVATMKNLIAQSNRWSTIANQSKNDVIGLMHVNYALGFLKAARRLASDADIERITGNNVTEMHYLMEEQQSSLISAISQKCPDLGLSGVVALNAGWTG